MLGPGCENIVGVGYQGRDTQKAMNPEAAIQNVVFRSGKQDRPEGDENLAILEL